MDISEAAYQLSRELLGTAKCRVHAGTDTIFVDLYHEFDKDKIPNTYQNYPVVVQPDPAGDWWSSTVSK